MGDDDWKQSAVMFYAFGTILTLISFVCCCVYSLYKNSNRKRNIQKIFCFCCYKDPLTHYDTIQRNDDDEDMTDEMLPEQTSNVFSIETKGSDDDEIDINIHGESSPPMKTMANSFELDNDSEVI